MFHISWCESLLYVLPVAPPVDINFVRPYLGVGRVRHLLIHLDRISDTAEAFCEDRCVGGGSSDEWAGPYGDALLA